MAEDRRSTPTEDVQRLYEDAEKRTAQAFDEVVSRASFGELLARMTENVVGLTKIGTDAFDLVLRNMRLAGRSDVTRLARQLGRTEDKLELVLQEVERLHEALEASQGSSRSGKSRRSSGGQRNSANGSQRGSSSPRSSGSGSSSGAGSSSGSGSGAGSGSSS
jgi:hypothetical protein